MNKRRSLFLAILLASAFYYFFGVISQLRFPAISIPIFWLPLGFSLGVILHFGPRVSAFIIIGSIAVGWSCHLPLPAIMASTIAEWGSVLITTFLLKRIQFNLKMDRFLSVLQFVVIGVFGCGLLSTIIQFILSFSFGTIAIPSSNPSYFLLLLINAMVSILVTCPMVIDLISRIRSMDIKALSARTMVTPVAILVCLLFNNLTTYSNLLDLKGLLFPLRFTLYPLLFWALLCCGMKGWGGGILLTVIFSAFGTINGYGPFAGVPDMVKLTQIWGFGGIITLLFLLLNVLNEERKKTVENLSAALSEKEILVQAIEIQLRFLQSLIDAIPCPIFYKNAHGEYTGCNTAFERLLEKRKEEILGQTVHSLFPDDLARFYHQKDLELMQQGGAQRYESVVEYADGSLHDVIFHKAAFLSSGGLMTGVIGVILDITERKQAEQALRKSETTYRNIFENAVEGFFQINPNGYFINVNPAFSRIMGYSSPEELKDLGSDFERKHYVDPNDQRHYRQHLRDRGIVENFEFMARRKDGSMIWLSKSVIAFRDKSGDVIHYDGIVTDITERKAAEAEKERLQQRLLQSQKIESIGTLAGGIAHDFNNILSAIIGFTELSFDEVEKGSMLEENLKEIYAGGKRARDLVRQILDFARRSVDEVKPIQVGKIVTEVLKFIRSSIPSTIEIRQEVDSDALIEGNPVKVHQILMNLCTNAAHAMASKGGTLRVTLKNVDLKAQAQSEVIGLNPGSYIKITVSDTGVGMAPQLIDHIFDPYFTTKGPGEGTGMGLAMVHGIVDTYKGKIRVSSKVDCGTTFSVYLPIVENRQQDHSASTAEIPRGQEKILLVDDEVAIVNMGAKILQQLGYMVTTRTSPVDALDLFRSKSQEFDLVITDMTMPTMTGERLVEELLSLQPTLPIILCTGYSKKVFSKNAGVAGIKALIHKPFLKSDLARIVRNVLDRAKQMQSRSSGR